MEEKETYPFVINVKTIAGQSIKETCYAAARLSKQLGCLIETEINDVTITVGGLMTEQDAYESWLFYSKQKNNNMNELPTPETDAELNLYFRHGEAHQVTVPWIEFTRKLERERDEARNIAEKLSKQGLDIMDENRSLKRERDTALDEAQAYSKGTWQSLRDSQDEVLRLTFENREISQELDRARDTIMKIDEIFIDSEDMHDDWMKVGNIARTFCEKYI